MTNRKEGGGGRRRDFWDLGGRDLERGGASPRKLRHTGFLICDIFGIYEIPGVWDCFGGFEV